VWKIGIVIYLVFFIATPVLMIVGITGALLEQNFRFLYWTLGGMLLFSIVVFRAIVLLIGLFRRGRTWFEDNDVAIITRNRTTGEPREFLFQRDSRKKRLEAPRE
ncbi:MAG: hypothetical protein ACRDHP_03135, partial [Ktedonobacterales bacterium]